MAKFKIAQNPTFKEMGADLTIVVITDASIDRQVEQVEALVAGWGFDAKLSKDSIRALVESTAGVGDAIIKTYQQAFDPARLGN